MTNPLNLPPELIKLFQNAFPSRTSKNTSGMEFASGTSDTVWPFPVLETDVVEANKPQKPDNAIGIVHIYDPEHPKGGMTVAYQKSSPYSSGAMVDVAVHVCSTADSFSKKIGNAGATQKFLNGETIQLPLLKNYKKEDIAYAVKHAFTAFYWSM